jgi:antitoxin (DNA-binding transcriptional repressor) of toxin-antitoxin stability system
MLKITQHGVPLAKVLPLPQPEEQKKISIPGLNRGSMVMSDDFDDPCQILFGVYEGDS